MDTLFNHTHTPTHTCTRMHTCTHKYTHTNTNTHTHIHSHKLPCPSREMGTSLAGHIVPGVCFIIYGVWWSFISIWSHLKRTGSKLSFPTPPQSKKLSSHQDYGGNMGLGHAASFALERRDYELHQRSWLPQPFCTRVPLEPIIKIFCLVVGIISECVDVVQDPVTSRTYFRLHRASDGTFNDLSQLQHITMYLAFGLSGLVDLITLRVRCQTTSASCSWHWRSWWRGRCSSPTQEG